MADPMQLVEEEEVPEPTKADLVWNAEYDEAIYANPDDWPAYLVYGDWLLAKGNPVGHAIAKQENGFVSGYPKVWFGGAVEKALDNDELALEWKHGFVNSISMLRPSDEAEFDMQRIRRLQNRLDALLVSPLLIVL